MTELNPTAWDNYSFNHFFTEMPAQINPQPRKENENDCVPTDGPDPQEWIRIPNSPRLIDTTNLRCDDEEGGQVNRKSIFKKSFPKLNRGGTFGLCSRFLSTEKQKFLLYRKSVSYGTVRRPMNSHHSIKVTRCFDDKQ